jgi:hypothetical protein
MVANHLRAQFSLRWLIGLVAVVAVSLAFLRITMRAADGGRIDIRQVSAVPFQRLGWQRNGIRKIGMAKDIVAKGTVIGLTRGQVHEMLGLGVGDAVDNSEIYELHDNVVTAPSGDVGVGAARLHVSFDAEQIARACHIELQGYVM